MILLDRPMIEMGSERARREWGPIAKKFGYISIREILVT